MLSPVPVLETANVGNLDPGPGLPMSPAPFIPVSIGNYAPTAPTVEIANAQAKGNPKKFSKAKRSHPATTIEPRVYPNGIAIYIRAAYWVDHNRQRVLYIQSTDYERLKDYADEIRKWFYSPNRTKPVSGDALKNIGIQIDGL